MAPPPPPPRPATNFEAVGNLFREQRANGSLVRIWRLAGVSQKWTYYDPRPIFARFNTLARIDLAADPPPILVVNVSSRQQFRGYTLYEGWNYIPVEAGPPVSPRLDFRTIDEIFRPLVDEGTLTRVWRLDSRTQRWQFYDPDPAVAVFNTLHTVNLGAVPPVVVSVNVTRTQEFRGQTLHRGWNHVILR